MTKLEQHRELMLMGETMRRLADAQADCLLAAAAAHVDKIPVVFALAMKEIRHTNALRAEGRRAMEKLARQPVSD